MEELGETENGWMNEWVDESDDGEEKCMVLLRLGASGPAEQGRT